MSTNNNHFSSVFRSFASVPPLTYARVSISTRPARFYTHRIVDLRTSSTAGDLKLHSCTVPFKSSSLYRARVASSVYIPCAFKRPRLRKRLNEDLAFVVVVVVSHVRFLDVFTDVTASRGGVEKTKIERRTGHRREVTNEGTRACE